MRKIIAMGVVIAFAAFVGIGFVWAIAQMWREVGAVVVLAIFVGLPLAAAAVGWALSEVFGPVKD